MTDELIEIYNENNAPLGIKKMKSEAHKNGLWHRSSHVWIYNSVGEILLQLRTENKEFYPNMWDISAAGHISAGENPIIAALREIKEEIGLFVKPEDLEFFKIKKNKVVCKNKKNNEFDYIYFLRFDGDIKTLSLQNEEVAKIQFFSVDKIKEELKTHSDKYVPHGDYWFEIIEKIKHRTIF